MSDAAAPPTSRARQVRSYVAHRVTGLQGLFLADAPSARADLAKLRKCAPQDVGTDPQVWALTLEGLPDALIGRGDDPSRAERAIHASLVLYAHHQQSHRDEVHRPGLGLGVATRALALARSADDALDNSVLQRLHQVGLASDWAARLHHLRALIVLMRSESPTVALDYGRLAGDLYRLQDPTTAPSVLLAWGRDLYRAPKNENPGEPS